LSWPIVIFWLTLAYYNPVLYFIYFDVLTSLFPPDVCVHITRVW